MYEGVYVRNYEEELSRGFCKKVFIIIIDFCVCGLFNILSLEILYEYFKVFGRIFFLGNILDNRNIIIRY